MTYHLSAAHRTIGGQNHQGMDGSVVLTVVLIESAGSAQPSAHVAPHFWQP